MVTLLAWMAAKLVSSNSPTIKDSAACWRASRAAGWYLKPEIKEIFRSFTIGQEFYDLLQSLARTKKLYKISLNTCDVVRFQSHGDFSNQSLERQSPDEILRGMLIPSYFFEGKLSSSIPSFFLVLFRRRFHAISGRIQIGGHGLSIELHLSKK